MRIVSTVITSLLFCSDAISELVEIDDMSSYSIESSQSELKKGRENVLNLELQQPAIIHSNSSLGSITPQEPHSGAIVRIEYSSDDLSTIVPPAVRVDVPTYR